MKQTSTYPVAAAALAEAGGETAEQERTNINQFVATAVAEKIAALETARCFDDRKNRADFKALSCIMKRCGGERPRPGDEMAD
jgi:hypothetical protein